MKHLSCLMGVVALSTLGLAGEGNQLAVTVFEAREANVNAYVFSDGKGTLIVDSTRNSNEAGKLAALARSKGSAPEIVLITHGHPDHYLGMSALKKEFPNARILVATNQIKDDIIAFTKFMESVKWLEGEPTMKPKSASNPNGFDYQNEIGVLASDHLTMPGGSILEVNSTFPTTEAPHETVLFSKDLNSVFASDLVYNKVHLWLGVGVTADAIRNWQSALRALKETYGPLMSNIYPGHGVVASAALFDTDMNYMNDLLAAVREAKSEEGAKAVMMKKYPGWANSEFLLAQSVKFQMDSLREKGQ
jgi:glyoxylase-like metal-dependent hydrolase (beta-lactamase superfamily II)